jgi:hypothetical protein
MAQTDGKPFKGALLAHAERHVGQRESIEESLARR